MAKAKAAAPKKSSAPSNKAGAKKAGAKKTPASTSAAKKSAAKVAKAAPKAAPKAAKKAAKATSKPAVKVATKAAKTAKKSPAAKAVKKAAVIGAVATVATAATVAVVSKLAKTAVKASGKKAAPAAKKPVLKKAQAIGDAKAHHMPAPPSSRMTLLKLGFSSKEQAAILAAPHGFKIPDNADEPATLDAQYDFILIFVENITEAEVICASLNPSLRPKGRAWVAWPKGGASDINLDQLSGMVEAEGLQKITSLSLDERWSAVKFMHPKAER